MVNRMYKANLIMVPRSIQPMPIPQNVPVNFNHQPRQMGVPSEVDIQIRQITGTVSMPFMTTDNYHDPWLDYRQWHQPDSKADIQLAYPDIDSKFWDRTEFRDMLMQMPITLLVQSMGHYGWRLGFDNTKERDDFNHRFVETKKQHYQQIKCTYEHWIEMQAWVKDNIKGMHNIKEQYTVGRGDRTVDAWIRDYTEAMHFKLRWHNIKEVEAHLEEEA